MSLPVLGQWWLDTVVACPVLFAFEVVGTGLYLITLPFSLAVGNADEAAEQLVISPAKNTFVCCLDSVNLGRQK